MIINCTLEALMIPGFAGLDPPFGTKKPNGEMITGEENNNNVMMPFKIMRPITVPEDSSTTQIQTNCVFEFTVGGISLTLGAAAYSGCRVSVINSASTDATVIIGGLSVTAKAKEVMHLEYVGGVWIVVDDFADASMAINLALDYAGLAGREVSKTIRQRMQSGTALIKNRGVISGCSVTKSTSAIRNLNLLTGAVFMNGAEMSCPAFDNAVLVPSNNDNVSKTCYAYIYINASGKIQFAISGFNEPAPDDSIPLYLLTIPAANNETGDPNLASVSLADVRRMEAGYPAQFNSVAYVSVALPFSVIDNEYEVSIELLDFRGGGNQRSLVYPAEKASNGFKIYSDGTLDMVKVRWVAFKNTL